MGVPSLENIWTNNVASRKAAGVVNQRPSFEEYVELLRNAAAIHGNGGALKQTWSRQVNFHGWSTDDEPQDEFEGHIRDMDTDIDDPSERCGYPSKA